MAFLPAATSRNISLVLLGCLCLHQILPAVQASAVNNVIEFSSDTAKDASNLLGVSFVSRVMVPYGPDKLTGQADDDTPYRGFAYGVEAIDRVVYDKKNRYFYTVSGKGYMSVTDFSDASKPFVTEFAFNVVDKYGELEVSWFVGLLRHS